MMILPPGGPAMHLNPDKSFDENRAYIMERITETNARQTLLLLYRFVNFWMENRPEELRSYLQWGLELCDAYGEGLEVIEDDNRLESIYALSLLRLENSINPVTENRRVLEFLKRTVVPPVSTINNFEINVMNLAHTVRLHDERESYSVMAAVYAEMNMDPIKAKMYSRIRLATVGASLYFCTGWKESGFARIELSHKLAAALALTDVPDDMEIHAPWGYWSLILPPIPLGIEFQEGVTMDYRTGEAIEVDSSNATAERLWCRGTEPEFIIGKKPGLIGACAVKQQSETAQRLLSNLVRGTCLCATKESKTGRWGVSSKDVRGKTKKLPEDLSGEKYVIGRAVSIDMRDALHEVLTGKTRAGSSPGVQFLVRGHWRNQAKGPQRSLRERIWIEPHWKGDEEMRTLLRGYKLEN